MRRQYRLIDLMAAVAVIGVLLGLITSGLFQSRAYFSRFECASNMRMVAIGLVQYQNAHGVFPMSVVAGTGHGVGHSGLTMILPYLEATELYNAYNFKVENWHPANSTVVGSRHQIFLCPANPNTGLIPAARVQTITGAVYPGSSMFGPGHYAVNWGGGRSGWGRDFEIAEGRYRGVMMTVAAQGPDGPTRCIAGSDIKDGLNSTLLVAEKRDSQGWAVGGWAGSEFDAGPSPSDTSRDPRARKVYSGSFHGGGINGIFCDGSGHWLPETMDRRVWYALLTRGGGEAVSLDDDDHWQLGKKP